MVGRANTIRLLDKASELIDLVAHRGVTTPAELAQELGEPRPSVYRLIEALTRAGMVRVASNGRGVELGMAWLHLGTAAADALVERRAALPAMAGLHAKTDQTVNLLVRREMRAVCVEQIEGRHIALLQVKPGESLPLHAGAAPRVLLAYQSDLWSAYFEQAPFSALTPKTPRSADALRAKLEEIRARGFAVSDDDVTPGVAAIGAPVLDASGAVRAALAAAGLRQSIIPPQLRVAEAVVAAAEEAGRALAGYAEA